MPVIVRELIIRATVNDSQGKAENSSASSAPAMNNDEKEQVVAACVQQVLEILDKKKER